MEAGINSTPFCEWGLTEKLSLGLLLCFPARLSSPLQQGPHSKPHPMSCFSGSYTNWYTRFHLQCTHTDQASAQVSSLFHLNKANLCKLLSRPQSQPSCSNLHFFNQLKLRIMTFCGVTDPREHFFSKSRKQRGQQGSLSAQIDVLLKSVQ